MAKVPAGQIHLKLEDLAEKMAAGLTDRWGCPNCNLKDDIHFMQQHHCKDVKK